jgi:lysozyme
MPISSALDLIKAHEGCRLTAYADTEGKWTIGWGRCVPGIKRGDTCTQEQADAWLEEAYRDAAAAACRVAQRAGIDWSSLGDARQAVLIDMAYELGEAGLGAFHRTLAAIRDGLYIAASAHGLDSLWARQVPHRASQDMRMLQSGLWPQDGEST